jgi:type I restriction enzyme, S subunit
MVSNQNLLSKWEIVRLSDACDPDRKMIAPGSALFARPYLSLEHIESGTGRILRLPEEIIEDEGRSTTHAFDQRHVLYGKLRPYLNKVALPDFEGRCTTEAIPLLPRGNVDRTYLAWLLRRDETVQTAMEGRTGSRMPRANMEELLNLEIPLPPLEMQRRIAAKLEVQMKAVETARIAAEEQLETINAMPAALLREAFSGRI